MLKAIRNRLTRSTSAAVRPVRKTKLGVNRLEDRLTPATWIVHIPAIPEPEVLFDGRNNVAVVENSGKIAVTVNGRAVAERSAAGIDRVELYGSSSRETFVVQATGLNLRIHESDADWISLVGTRTDSPVVPNGNDIITISDSGFNMSGRRVVICDNLAERLMIDTKSGDDRITLNTQFMPVFVDSGDGADTIIIQKTGVRTFLPDFGTPGPVAAFIDGGTGENTYVLGNKSPNHPWDYNNAATTLDRYHGPIHIIRSGKLHIFDIADTDNNNYWLGDGKLVRNGAEVLTYLGMHAIDLHAGNGNDLVRASENVPVRLYGYAGNDILIGGYRDDTIDGGIGWDILVGDSGRDTLRGGAGQDILIGDRLSYAFRDAAGANDAKLRSWRNYWTLGQVTIPGYGTWGYNTRVNYLRPTLNAAISDDGVLDLLQGGEGQDWFWGSWYSGTLNLIYGEVSDRGRLSTTSFSLYAEAVR